MNAQLPGYTLSFVQSMLSVQAGTASGWFKSIQISTIFQPAFSLPYKKAVGFEANLRGASEDGSVVGPRTMFGPVENFAETCLLDLLGTTVHVHNFAASHGSHGLLFLNLHPEVFLEYGHTAPFLASLFEHYGIAGRRVVLDIPASALDLEGLAAAIDAYRSLQCLISIDDVGVEPADLDNVMRTRPDIVKMDHAVAVRAGSDDSMRDTLTHAISLLHEMGALVMLEGLESEAEALLAIETDADFATGFYFGPLLDDLGAFNEPKRLLENLWNLYKKKRRPAQQLAAQSRSSLDESSLYFSSHVKKLRAASSAEINRYRDERRPFVGAIRQAGASMQAGDSLRVSAQEFLKLDGAIRCYLLGSDGAQVGLETASALAPPARGANYLEQLHGAVGDWSRRDFFRRAMTDPGVVQVSRQYSSLNGYRQCVTFSIAIHANNQPMVVCGDVDWSMHARKL